MSLLAQFDPELAGLLGIRTQGLSSRPRSRRQDISEDEEKSIIRSLRDSGLNMLGAAGNFLDVPGSVVRDTINLVSGGRRGDRNPLDQLLPWNWFSAEGRTTGRDLARNLGLARSRDTTGNFWGGLGTELALDPLTYLSLGASALGKSGRVASKAGLMDDLLFTAAGKANVPVSTIGRREALLTTSLDDLLRSGGISAVRKARQAAKAEGATLKALREGPLGGQFGVGLPFMQPSAVWGTGPKSVAAAKALDTATKAVRYAKIPGTEIAPIDAAVRLFSAPIHNTKDPMMQAFARRSFFEKIGGMSGVQTDMLRLGNDLKASGLSGDDAAEVFTMLAEGLSPADIPAAVRGNINETMAKLTPEQFANMRRVTDQGREAVRQVLDEGRALGKKTTDLEDKYVDYFPRFISEALGYSPARDKRLISGTDASQFGRLDVFRDVPGGTVAVRNLVRDPALRELIAEGATTKKIADFISTKHGEWLPDAYRKFSEKKGKWVEEEAGRYKALAQKLGGYRPETLDVGIFGNHPLKDLNARLLAAKNADVSIRTLTDVLTQPDVVKFNAPVGRETVQLKNLIAGKDGVGLRWGKKDSTDGFGYHLRKALGLPDDMPVKELGEARVSREIAEDIQKYMRLMEGPEAMHEWLDIVDGVTNFGKGMWTSIWPSFHVRNRLSGLAWNFMKGITNLQAENLAGQYMKGQAAVGLKDIPAVQQEWARRHNQFLKMPPLRGVERDRVAAEISDVFGKQGEDYMHVMDAYARFLASEFGQDTEVFFRDKMLQKGELADLGPDALLQGRRSPQAYYDAFNFQQEYVSQLPKAQQDALERLKSSSYGLSRNLRSGSELSQEDYVRISNLQDAIVDSPPLQANTTLYRSLPTAPGGTGRTGVKVEDLKIGDETTSRSVVSTSARKAYLELDKPNLAAAEIRVPAGNKALAVDLMPSSMGHESELLLPVGTRFRVADIKTLDNGKKVYVFDVVGQNADRFKPIESLRGGEELTEFFRAGQPTEKWSQAARSIDGAFASEGRFLPLERIKPGGETSTLFQGNQAPKLLRPVQDVARENYRRPLSDYSQRVYRDASPENAAELIREAQVSAGGAFGFETFLANTPTLALGQHGNTGVMLEFNASKIKGQVNKKPGWDFAYNAGDAEFISRDDHETLKDALLSVTISKDAVRDIYHKRIVNALESSDNWHRSDMPNGDVVYTDRRSVADSNTMFQGGAQPRGAVQFKDAETIVTAFKNADFSTLVHETAHIFRRSLPERLQAQAARALGVTEWDRAADEAFATGFERFMRDGAAPTPQLAGVFAKFKDWLTSIYRSIVGTPLAKDVPDELRAVFNEMLGAPQGFTGKASARLPPLTDEMARRIFGEMAVADNALARTGQAENAATDITIRPRVAEQVAAKPGSLQDMLSGQVDVGAPAMRAGRVLKKWAGLTDKTTFNPAKATYRGVGGATENTWGPQAAGDEVGHYIEGRNRLAPYIYLMQKGASREQAGRIASTTQVLYGNKHFTPAEQQIMKRLLPFYSFQSRIGKQVFEELAQRPGGRLGATIRAQRLAHQDAEMAPDYVQDTASIPLGGALGELPPGVDRYLTGFGMMYEDPLSFGPTPRAAGLELLSRTNPFIKAPLEYFTNQSFFQKSPFGGRPLEDLDPLIGRLVANVTGQKKVPDYAKLPQWLETTIANSPASKFLTTARQATDTRDKSRLKFLLNFLTGVRVQDVSPGAKEAIVRKLLQEAVFEKGGTSFERLYFRPEDKAAMTPQELAVAEQLEAVLAVMGRRAKERKQAEQTTGR